MSTPEVQRLRASGYRPMDYYNNNADLRAAVDFIGNGIGGVDLSDVRDILLSTDYYMSFADFEDYCAAQDKASALYADRDTWNRMSLINIAKAGRFSSDRSIKDYAENIWNANPVNKK